MGIPGPGEPPASDRSNFSEDMLSIELCGPKQQNLSIIDIPGIFRTPTEGVTTTNDMGLVRRIMERHIKDERTIILAVIPANVDAATQEILGIAKEVDPKGIRTLGVLTKPDIIDQGGEEDTMLLVEGKRHLLHLGYHIVRNRGQSELSSDMEARTRKEKEFFAKAPWSRLEASRTGIPALQTYLQTLLVDITRREFPKVQTQMMKNLNEARHKLKGLGANRQSTDQQRRYLLDLSTAFQSLVNSALDAYYSRDRAFTEHRELRLATLAFDQMTKFSDGVENGGHTVSFDEADDTPVEAPPDPEPEDQEYEASIDTGVEFDMNINDKIILYPELEAFWMELLILPSSDEDFENTSIMDWIEEEYKAARGFGMGATGPSVLPTIWQKQTKKWDSLALEFMVYVIFDVHHFICIGLSRLCLDDRVRAGLWTILQEKLLQQYEKAVDHVKFILHVERFGTPLTTNHYFNENLQKCRSSRLENSLTEHAEIQYNARGQALEQKVVKLNRVTQSTSMDNTKHAVQEIHDTLVSYYKVARKRFVDTVCMQGSDYHLLTGPSSPLRLFSTDFVSQLSESDLEIIAGEENSTKQLRKSLTDKIAALEKGKKLLRL